MPKILMVDDEQECLEATSTLLREIGYEVIEASNAQEFLEIINEYGRLIDLIILDLDMPRMNGAEVLKEFGLYLEDKKIPILMYTSAYNKEDKYHLLDSLALYGAYAPIDCIPKNDPQRLLEEIALQLALRQDGERLTDEEREEKQSLDNKLKYRELDMDRLSSDPDWLRLLELNCKESGDTDGAERYRKMREDFLNRLGS